VLDAAPEPPKEGWFAPEAGHENLARYGGLDVAVAFIARRLGGFGSLALLLPDDLVAADAGESARDGTATIKLRVYSVAGLAN
jgi:hypothetical protein